MRIEGLKDQGNKSDKVCSSRGNSGTVAYATCGTAAVAACGSCLTIPTGKPSHRSVTTVSRQAPLALPLTTKFILP